MYACYWRILVLFSMIFSASAWSHNLGEGYVYLTVTDEALTGRLELTLGDVNKAVPLGSTPGERPTEDSSTRSGTKVFEYLRKHLAFFSGDTRHQPVFGDYEFMHLDMASFVRIDFLLPDLGPPSTEIPVYYSILSRMRQEPPGQILIERNDTAGIEANEAQFSAIFGPGKELQEIKLGRIPWFEYFSQFRASWGVAYMDRAGPHAISLRTAVALGDGFKRRALDSGRDFQGISDLCGEGGDAVHCCAHDHIEPGFPRVDHPA